MPDSDLSAVDLDGLFDALNHRHFGGSLRARVEWSNRMRAIAGNCDWRRGVIRLSYQYHQRYPHELEPTLLHEMLHLALRRGHDTVFQAEARRLGAPMRASGEAAHRPYKYVYACPRCGLAVRRRLRGTWSCGRCGNGRYDERFRLRLVERL